MNAVRVQVNVKMVVNAIVRLDVVVNMKTRLLIIIFVFTLVLIPVATKSFAEEFFNGYSSIDPPLSEVAADQSIVMTIKFLYTSGPYVINNLVPVIEVNPSSTGKFVKVDVDSLEIRQGQPKRIPVTLTVDPHIEHEKIFLSISYAGNNFKTDKLYKSSWNDQVALDVIVKNSPIPEPEQHRPIPENCGSGTILQDGICIVEKSQNAAYNSSGIWGWVAEHPVRHTVIENIEGTFYYVSESIELNSHLPNISFHGVTFSQPYRHDPPRYTYSDVVFSDGTEETLSVLFNTAFTEHVKPQAGLVEAPDGIKFLVSMDLKELSPLKQIKSGIPIDEIQCKEGYVLMLKPDRKSIVCVFSSSVENLFERNFALTFEFLSYAAEDQDDISSSKWILDGYPIPLTMKNTALDYIRAEYNNQKILMYVSMEDESNPGLIEFTFPKDAASVVFDNQDCSIFDEHDQLASEFFLQVNHELVGVFGAKQQQGAIILPVQIPSDSSVIEVFSSKCSTSISMSLKEIAIENIKSLIFSDASYTEKTDVIEYEVREKNLEPFSVVSLKNIKQNYEHGEDVEFDVVAFGYVNWCLMPHVKIFYEDYGRALFEYGIVHSCPPPSERSSPSIVSRTHDDFKKNLSCKYKGNYTIMGTVYMSEWNQIGTFHCNGNEKFVPPTIHQMTIKDDANQEHLLYVLPETVVAKEGDVFEFTNYSNEEFWLVARHGSDVERDVFLHFDPVESREFNQIKSGNYTVSIEIDHRSISLMNTTITVK